MARRTARTGRTGRIGPTRAVTVAGVVAVVAATAAACGNDAGDDQHPDHRSFALHGRTLTVDSDDSALEIVPADVHRVEVTRWFRGTVVVGGDPRVTWAMKDDRLVLRLTCSGLVADCSARHRIEVPRGVAVKVEDGDGSVRAQGFEAPLTIRTQDGSVRVSDSTGPLTLDSGDGSVRATGVGSGRVHAATRDGSIHLELGTVPDLVESSSEDGSVTIALPHQTYRVTTRAEDGSVHVSVPRDPGSSHVIDARTRDGSVTVRTAG
ncbi:DUF4097 family beta strand repeat-containing protein [Streptomyces chiangmaiensis]|uniref:DUF4097 family beta strand repeat-containing protein n=1 Tax=Streptomyces chiangmaiensis TaxID=766497 RepID=A0ABU7FLM4_9ACTN|nr:DUF4097 family beta strand repeat-containing protein [Streptomyces chiangmaiensis]MED7825011.1 DUF4097 family beta strand repeat-containing protein [Streptomyces chiangmaiensis]